MFFVRFSDFRCFAVSPPVEIRPITLLVGENSVGKTSFLAGLRFILESQSADTQNPFNRAPYYLGGFEQIANYRGSRWRAKTFTLEIEIPSPATRHTFTFGKGPTQPQLESYEFSYDGDKVEIILTSDNPRVALSFPQLSPSAKIFDLTERGFVPPINQLRANLYYVRYLLDDLRFRALGRRPGRSEREVKEIAQIPREKIESIFRAYNSSARYLHKDVFASAPIRTQPFRTYTPSEVAASAEGSHVPLELARAKLRSPDRWKEIQMGLVSFGKDSGLFTDIDIRQFGKKDIDPFQVLVKVGGPAMNLVDVGYGVSQALPIVYQIQSGVRYDAFLLQQPEVHLHPKAQAELGTLIASTAAKRSATTFVVETHSDYILDRIRIEVDRGTIKPESVTVVFFDRDEHSSRATNLYLNDLGELCDVPHNFRRFFIQEHAKLLGI